VTGFLFVPLVGCGSSGSRPDAAVRATLLRGLAQIRASHDDQKLHDELVRTLATLREEHAATPAGRAARRLAIRGFAATVAGVQSRLDFTLNDSGNVEAATRDALSADRHLARGRRLLRAAARALGITPRP
jgi:hypothetical protein